MTARVGVPAAVIDSIQSRWPGIEEAWTRVVESELNALCEKYRARPHQALPARYSFVVVAQTATVDLVFRMTPDPAGANQAIAAQLLARSGAGPRVREVLRTSAGVWTVMDRVFPGVALNAADPGAVSIEDVAVPFRAMAQEVDTAGVLPSISSWLRERLNADALADIPPGKAVAPRRVRQRANALLRELETEESSGAVCHGDSHPGNLLVSDGQHRVLLIDPRGMRGSVAYDIGVLSLKISGYRHDSAVALARQLAEFTGVDARHAAAWIEIADAARV